MTTRLSEDLNKLRKSEKNYDIRILVGDDQNIKEFKAHSIILCARSEYFVTALSQNWAQQQPEEKTKEKEGAGSSDGGVYGGDNEKKSLFYRKPNISPYLFEIILE